ncbi:hypothetical protein QFC21_003975 [Naganishia friedmannii]|uniref:Uncharacterized protein n=1 Tax=Naganishia friedmannii TaxID=89922 RepID=A0ACC2VL09_9TREE|nr:hypothetical protein QFC21_003975 [Naganishia friedmannii]
MQSYTGKAATYVSARSANALISDLRPTTIAPSALHHLNLVLDELVEALVEAAGSIDPKDIKTKGVPRVFADVVVTGSAPGTPHRSPARESFRDRATTVTTNIAASPISNKNTSTGGGKTRVRTSSSIHFRAISSSLQLTKYAASLALGREAVNEAELELKAWKDGGGERNKGISEGGGFTRDPRGLRDGARVEDGEGEVLFPVAEAVEVLRCRIAEYSTLGNSEPPDSLAWKAVTDAWTQAGGSGEEDVLSPAGLYMTAIIE